MLFISDHLIQTSSLCLLAGGDLKLPEEGIKAPEKDEWIVVLGGSGTVGQFAVQVKTPGSHFCLRIICLTLLGRHRLRVQSPRIMLSIEKIGRCDIQFFKWEILTRSRYRFRTAQRRPLTTEPRSMSNSPRSRRSRVATLLAFSIRRLVATISCSKLSKARRPQPNTCLQLTIGNKTEVFAHINSLTKYNRSPFNTPSSIKEYRAELGFLCRPEEPLGREVTRDIASWIPSFEAHLAAGTIKPIAFQVIDGVGWKQVIQGMQDLTEGKANKKLVVRTQSE